MEQIPKNPSPEGAKPKEIETATLECGEPKSWVDIMIENIEEIPEQTKYILQQKVSGMRLNPVEQAELDRYRNKFWQEKFGINFADRNTVNNQVEERKSITEKRIKSKETEIVKESSGIYKEFAENFEKYIVYEDNDILVINKPAGISTQGKMPQEPYSIASLMRSVRPETAIVHRIDKETSGILILGKTPEIRGTLIRNWKNAEKEKWYAAISNGNYEGKIIGSILPIEEKGAGVRISKGLAKTSSTYFNKIMGFEKNGKLFSLLRVRIFSGRKHQIRVSLRHLGFPIVGDKLYNKQSRANKESSRQLLHAYKTILAHPRTGEIMEFTAPMPEDMRKFIGSYPNDILE